MAHLQGRTAPHVRKLVWAKRSAQGKGGHASEQKVGSIMDAVQWPD